MKANRLLSTLSLAAAVGALLAGCAAERRAPQPSPAPSPAARPVSTPLPTAPRNQNWRDAPITPGAWFYRPEATGSAAVFGSGAGDALATFRCDRTHRQIVLARAGSALGPVPLTVMTTDGTRAFSASPQAGVLPQIVTHFVPGDPLLDSIAFSRGRIGIEAPGLPTLYLPAWPEIGRVIEDCR